MELTVPNEEISELKEGQKIKYRFNALPYREYGISRGKIIQISSDTAVVGENNHGGEKSNLPYEARAIIKKIALENDQGQEVAIKPVFGLD